MLNILISVLLLNVSILSFFFTYRLNRVEQIFSGISATYISESVELNTYTEKYYFQKEELIEKTVYYFETNLKGIEHSLRFAFREDENNTVPSDYPNIVQINITASILFENEYQKNVRFFISGRKVSKDWFAAL